MIVATEVSHYSPPHPVEVKWVVINKKQNKGSFGLIYKKEQK